MIRKIPLSDHYYKESEIDDFLDEKSDKTHGHGDINKDGQITANASSVNKIAVTDSSNSIKTVDVLPLNKVTHQNISGKVNKTDIQDNFSSTAVDKPLSANKGTELKNLVDTKANSDNVYSKAETMSASDIRQAIADGVGNIDIFEVVSELPTSNIKGNKFYLTPNNENIDKNIYDINIYVDNNWETIDSLEFDISNYPTTSEVTILLNGKVDIVEGKGLSSNDFTDALKNKLENNVLTQHQSLANYVQKSQTQGLIKNDGTIDTNNYLTKETAPKIYNYGFVDSNLVLHLIYIDTEVSITKTIIQTGGSSQITILVTDEEGNPLEDIPVDLYANGVKVGQTVDTNANGLSIHTYTGSGSGKVELQAKIGSVVSGTLSVWDTLQYDGGTINNHNDNVWTSTWLPYINRGDEYSTIERQGNEAAPYLTITGDICIEFDIMTTMSNAGQLLSVRNDSTTLKAITGSDCGGVSNTWKHTKITIIGSKLTVEGSSIIDFDVTGFNRLYFRSASGYQTSFKDLKVYSA